MDRWWSCNNLFSFFFIFFLVIKYLSIIFSDTKRNVCIKRFESCRLLQKETCYVIFFEVKNTEQVFDLTHYAPQSLLYPLKVSENIWFSDVFWGHKTGIRDKRVKCKSQISLHCSVFYCQKYSKISVSIRYHSLLKPTGISYITSRTSCVMAKT